MNMAPFGPDVAPPVSQLDRTCAGASTDGGGIMIITTLDRILTAVDAGIRSQRQGRWLRHPGRLFVHFGDRIQRRCTRTLDPISSAVTTVGIRCDHHGEEYGLDTTAATCPAPPTVSFAGALASSPIHLCPRQLHFEATAFS